MKRTDFKAKSSVFYLGKGIIILSLVVTSSLGFILGFFVGRSAQPSPQERPSAIMPPDIADEQNVLLPEEVFSSEQMPSQEVRQPEVRARREAVAVQKPAMKDPQPSLKDKVTREAPADKKTQKGQAKEKTSKPRKYTVQAGAFSNPDEAESLKSALGKKGFRAFTIEAKAKNNKILHKVMVGEYGTRKEAEVLSLKLKKSEGLRTFVTIRTE